MIPAYKDATHACNNGYATELDRFIVMFTPASKVDEAEFRVFLEAVLEEVRIKGKKMPSYELIKVLPDESLVPVTMDETKTCEGGEPFETFNLVHAVNEMLHVMAESGRPVNILKDGH